MLRPIQEIFDPDDSPDLLSGLGNPDDAALWRLDADRALIITTDFFTPVVDDPYDYGAIAAANSLSDVYAMGGEPFLALNIAAVPKDLPLEITRQIVRGGAEKAREAGVVIAGGHTVQDDEPKYGLVALGFVHPEKILRKGGARPGDQLVLTKPLGMGVTSTALKDGLASEPEIAEAVQWMSRLNREAAQLARRFALRGGTDVTGFGLLGHGTEMAQASGVRLQIEFERVPFITPALKYAEAWTFPGGTADNRTHFGPAVDFGEEISEVEQMLLFDAQTSGGLLLAVPSDTLPDFLAEAERRGQPAWLIGEVMPGRGIQVIR